MRVITLSVSVLALLASGQVYAADMYRAPEGVSIKDEPVYAPAWTGFYAGINGGYGWGADDSKLNGTANSQTCTGNPEFPECTPTSGSGARKFGASGGFGGGQIGYNWQPVSGGGYKDGPVSSHFVFGVEADLQGSAIDGSGSVNLLSDTASAKGKDDLDWFGTIGGRLGYAMDTTLLYFKGGLAFGGVNDSLSVTPAVGATSMASKSNIDTGFALGGGVEYLFSPRWSGKVEYQYIDLGDDKLSTTAGSGIYAAAATLDAEHKYQTVRLGLNYHFNGGFEPLK